MCLFLYFHNWDDIFHLTSFLIIRLLFSHAYHFIRSGCFLFQFDQYIEVQIFMQNISHLMYDFKWNMPTRINWSNWSFVTKWECSAQMFLRESEGTYFWISVRWRLPTLTTASRHQKTRQLRLPIERVHIEPLVSAVGDMQRIPKFPEIPVAMRRRRPS